MTQSGIDRRSLFAEFGLFVLAVAIVWLLWHSAQILLVLFAAVLGAVLLDGLTGVARRYLGWPRWAALTLVILGLALLVGIFALLTGPKLVEQTEQLAEMLPESLARLWEWAQSNQWSRFIVNGKPGELLPSASGLFGSLSSIFSTTLGGLATALIIVVLAIYLAINPPLYINALLRLLPDKRRAAGEQISAALGRAMRQWLVGRFASMFVVGVMTATALWLIDLPAALALGVLAGLLSFVPYFGPIASTVPALLIALQGWPWQPLWVLLIYGGVQFLEGNLITPMVQNRMVSLPPAALLSAQLVIGYLFGLLGLLLATPLAVVAIVLIQILYIRNTLDEDVRILGEQNSRG